MGVFQWEWLKIEKINIIDILDQNKSIVKHIKKVENISVTFAYLKKVIIFTKQIQKNQARSQCRNENAKNDPKDQKDTAQKGPD